MAEVSAKEVNNYLQN